MARCFVGPVEDYVHTHMYVHVHVDVHEEVDEVEIP